MSPKQKVINDEKRQEVLLKKRENERKRMERIKSDPVLLEKYKNKERLKYLPKKEKGTVKSVDSMTPYEHRLKKKQWKSNSRRSRLKKKAALNNNMEKKVKLDSSDSDSDSDVDYKSLLDVMSGKNNENGAGSSKNADDVDEGASTSKLPGVDGESLNQNHPVLSLKCLHEDTDDENLSSKMDEDDPSSKFIDVNEVPELPLNDKDELQVDDILDVESDSEEHPNLEPVDKKPSAMILIPVVNFPAQMPIIPLRTSHEGVHNFRIKIDISPMPKRSDCAVFSESRNKLYVSKDVPFVVLVSANNVPEGSVIRVQAVFSRPEHACASVTRCPTHAQQDYIKECPAYEHFVQCINEGAIYEKNLKNSKMSVSVPYVKPQGGDIFSSYIFKLTCFNSCVGGINRRPFTLVFTLEKNKILLGRQVIEAKVCACPTRDCKSEDDKKGKRKFKNDVPLLPQQDVGVKSGVNIQPKPAAQGSSQHLGPSQISSSEKQKYTISVQDRESFEFLQHMKVLYEMNVQPILPDT